MKICFLYPNKRNYSETFIEYHKQYLQPSNTLTGGWRPYLDENNKSIFTFPISEIVRILIKRVFPFLYPRFYNYFLSRHFKSIKPDIIFAEYGPTGCAVLEVSKHLGIPLVVHFHGFDAFEKVTLNSYKSKYKELFNYVKGIYCVSIDMVNQLNKLGAPLEKLHFVSCGVITNLFKGAEPQKSSRQVIAVGRFAMKKGPMNSIKAFNIVLKSIPDAKLVMIGKGELFDECVQLAEQLGIKQNIEFIGIKNHAEILEELKKSRLFIQHSMINPINGDSEGTPTSVLEAASVGLPIVSTNHAGIKQAVEHGKTGFLVEEGDFSSMASYIIKLLNEPELAHEMGKKGREKMIREYDIEIQTQKLIDVIQQRK